MPWVLRVRAVFPLGLACAMMKEIGSNWMVEDAKAGNTRYFLSGGLPLSSSEFLCQCDIPYFLIWEFWVAADIGISRYRLYVPGAGAGILGFGPWVSGHPRRWWAPGIPVWSAFPWPSIAWSCPCTSFGTKPGSSFLGPWEEPHCSVALRGGTS